MVQRVGTTYDIPPAPPDPESTDWFEVGPLEVGIEYRRVDPEALEEIYADSKHLEELREASPAGGFTDEGVSIHIVCKQDHHEFLRFDMFRTDPHYHYVDKDAATNTIVNFDVAAHGPMIAWTLGQLRNRLPDMLRYAGASVASQVTPELGIALSQRVEAHLRSIGELS